MDDHHSVSTAPVATNTSYVDTPLDERHLLRLRAFGSVHDVDAGRVLGRPGDPVVDFHVVISGEVAILIEDNGSVEVLATLGPGSFLG